jgi:hypothetical protein
MRDFIIPTFVAVALIFALPLYIVHAECDAYEKLTGRQTLMQWGSCYVKDGGQWYRWDEYKLRNAATGNAK